MLPFKEKVIFVPSFLAACMVDVDEFGVMEGVVLGAGEVCGGVWVDVGIGESVDVGEGIGVEVGVLPKV